jgi:malonyl-CoA/methylmalonyl-CoA synthetase
VLMPDEIGRHKVSLLSIFASGGIAVPLCTSHPANEMRYVLEDSTPSILIATSKFRSKAEEILDNDASRMLRLEDFPPSAIAPVKVEVELLGNDWKDTNRGALTIYTSGTTNLPKGVVATHKSLGAQSSSLIAAWKMSQEDHLLHVLPLHHVHGILNATLMPLMAGSTIEFLFPFSPSSVWTRLVNGVARAHDPKKREMITVFTAVPTVYNRLILSLPQQPLEVQQAAQSAIKHLRLAMSGSAALPGSIRDNWRVLAGTAEGGGTILERYGMTEVGMALSNRLSISQRIENGVGWPLPGVEARLVDIETGQEIMTPQKEGEIQLRGDTVFREYWNKPDATAMEFVKDGGWFKTGDVATRDADGCYFIQGRRSVDIIKSGGEKISALEVERELLKLPQVVETTVVGIPDDDWGQRVAAIVVINEQAKKEKWGLDAMRLEMKKSLASYKVPTVLRMVDEIPRNQMGKSICSLPTLGFPLVLFFSFFPFFLLGILY